MSPYGLPITVSLRRLFPTASFVACGDVRVTTAFSDSRLCRPNSLFAVMPGHVCHGVCYIDDAVRNGATALLVEKPVAGVAVPQCVVKNVRHAFGVLTAALHGNPARQLGIVGVTGTNGKTTVCWLVRHLLRTQGTPTGLLGTVEYSDGVYSEAASLTTPPSADLAQWLAAMVKRGCEHAALELSSHALDQDRAVAAELDVAVVTNVTADHFDYHHTAEAYRSAKSRIFALCKRGGVAVVNVDDPGSRSLLREIPSHTPVITYGVEQSADMTATVIEESLQGSRFAIHFGSCRTEVSTPLIGRHNISNVLAATAAVSHFGIRWDSIVDALRTYGGVPGRLERIDAGQRFDVFVDYAHTPDALQRCLSGLRGLTSGRLICVFGAGGDRDPAKRPAMGLAAGSADLAIVTSDNPRSEDPRKIADEVLAKAAGTAVAFQVELDRHAAIGRALSQARPGDCVLIAGKGHETHQILADRQIPFDDRAEARSWLATMTSIVDRVGAEPEPKGLYSPTNAQHRLGR